MLAQSPVLRVEPMLTVLQPILPLRAICGHGAVTDLLSPLGAARCNRTIGALDGAEVRDVADTLRIVFVPRRVNSLETRAAGEALH